MTFADAQALIADYDPAANPGPGHPRSGEQRDGPARCPGAARHRPAPGGALRAGNLPAGEARLTIHYVAFECPRNDPSGEFFSLMSHLGVDLSRHPILGWAQRLSVTDSRGTTAVGRVLWRRPESVTPSWHGQYEVHPQLAAETAWIERLGRTSGADRPACQASRRGWSRCLRRTRPCGTCGSAWKHLNDFHDPHRALNATIDALVAARRWLETDAPGHRLGPGGAGGAASRPRLRPGSASFGALAEPWRSLLARWRQTGGPGLPQSQSARSPAPFDGVTAAVIALESRDEHFGHHRSSWCLDVRTGLPYGDLPDQQHLTWWAVDNLGNYYLGEQGSLDPRRNPSLGRDRVLASPRQTGLPVSTSFPPLLLRRAQSSGCRAHAHHGRRLPRAD